MSPTFELGDLVMQGGPVSSGFYFSELTDWYSLTDSKSPVNERPQANGAFNIGNDYRQSAVISVKGGYLGDARVDVQAAKRTLTAAAGGGRPVTARHTEDDESSTRVVSVRSMPIDDDHGRTEMTFTIDMVAADPLRYGDPVVSVTGVPVASGGLIFPLGSGAALIDFGTGGASGRISVSNPGTAPVFAPFEVSGGLSLGFVVTDVTTGQVIEFDRQIPLGSTVFVNQRTGRAYIDAPGNDVSGSLTSKQWFAIGPGETHDIQFQPLGSVTGTPTLTFRTPPAYL